MPIRPRPRTLALHSVPFLALAALVAAPAAGRAAAAPRADWPLRPDPVVAHGFDPPAVTWGAGHRGVDLAGLVGQAVLAARAGVVTHAGPIAGRGVVVVDHGGTRTTYEPLSPTVAVGQAVDVGTVIGHLTRAGSHCLPAACLHWGLRRGREYLDPLALVGPRPVRLLPLGSAEATGLTRDDAAPVRHPASPPHTISTYHPGRAPGSSTEPPLRPLRRGPAGSAAVLW